MEIKRIKLYYKKALLILGFFLICGILFFSYSKRINENKTEELSQFAGAVNENITEQQMWGQPAKDVFPDITNPQYLTAREADVFLKDSDVVYFIQAKNDIYVYPQLILRHHEVVNDTIDGKPLAIAFCILSNTPVTYNRIVDNQTITFRSLGPLIYGNQIMFDKETDSYWNELTGVSFKGKLSGKRLEIVQPIEKTTWDKAKLFSSLKVLPPVLGTEFYRKNEQKYSPQARIEIGLMSMKKQKPDARLPAGTNGLGVFIHNRAQFYPEETIKKQQIINDNVGGWSLLIINNNNLGDQRIYRGYVNGQEMRFIVEGNQLLDKGTRSTWDLTGTAISGSLKGTKLKSPAYVSAYWYSWAAFYPGTSIYTTP